MKTKIAATVVGVSLLVGCAHQTPQVISRAGPVSALQVAIGDCMTDAPKAGAKTQPGTRAIVETLATVLISKGVNYLGQAATKAAEAKTWTAQGARNFQAPDAAFPQCLQVVRGRFLTEGPAGTPWELPAQSGWPPGVKKLLDERGLYLTDMPDFLFEARIVPSEDKKSFSVRPAIVTYLAPIDTRFLRPSKDRNIAVFFAFTPPGTKPTLESNPSATILVGAMEPWSTRKYKVDGAFPSTYESPWFTFSRKDASQALTVTALMTETQGEQAFLKFIGSVLSEPTVSADLKKGAENVVIPSAKEASENTEKNDNVTAVIQRDTYYQQYRVKLADCAKATDGDARRNAAIQAKLAMAAYMKADQATESKNGDVSPGLINSIKVDGTSADLKDRCQSLLSGLSN